MNFPKLKNKLIIAPIAGYSDIAFRVLCREYGAALAYTEMVSANSLLHKKTLVQLNEKDRPVTLQIFGNNTEMISKAATLFKDKVDIIDLNLGCPDYKIRRSGAGSALLDKPNKIDEILNKLQKLEVPITIKLRLHKNLNKIVKICESNDVSAICLHARTIKHGYSGDANLNAIKSLKESTDIKIIGNGNIFCPEDAQNMLDFTKCDYVMIGRAAISNPYIFRQTLDYLEDGKYKEMDKLKLFFEYYELYKEYKIDNFTRLLWHALSISKSMRNSKRKRLELSRCKNEKELFSMIQNQ